MYYYEWTIIKTLCEYLSIVFGFFCCSIVTPEILSWVWALCLTNHPYVPKSLTTSLMTSSKFVQFTPTCPPCPATELVYTWHISPLDEKINFLPTVSSSTCLKLNIIVSIKTFYPHYVKLIQGVLLAIIANASWITTISSSSKSFLRMYGTTPCSQRLSLSGDWLGTSASIYDIRIGWGQRSEI